MEGCEKMGYEDEMEEDNFYCEDARCTLVEDDSISPAEAAFMQGYDEAF